MLKEKLASGSENRSAQAFFLLLAPLAAGLADSVCAG
jgi:hypothetical protein